MLNEDRDCQKILVGVRNSLSSIEPVDKANNQVIQDHYYAHHFPLF
jgi:hypothetical protein